jgi:exonuclease V gamma subunit
MILFVSNKMEIPAGCFGDRLNCPPSLAPAAEMVFVQSTGREKRLSLELALCHGIRANHTFSFFHAFIDRVFQPFIHDYQTDSSRCVDVLVWKIMDIPPELTRHPDFGPSFTIFRRRQYVTIFETVN